MKKSTVKKKGYTVRTNKYKQDPFRPQPDLRIRQKSRRLHKPMGTENFCLRASRCKNSGKCKGCVPLYRLWKPKKKAKK